MKKFFLIGLISAFLCSFISPSLKGYYPQTEFYSDSQDINFENKLNLFFYSLKQLQNEGKLDGEVLIARGDKILLHLQSPEIAALGNHPQFMVGSISKQFFAVALLKALYDSHPGLNEASKIAAVKRQLHMPLSTFLPKDAAVWGGKMPAWANQVTLHQLLNHTSGVPNYFDGFDSLNSDKEKSFFEYPHSKKEIIQLVAQKPLLFTPGSKFSYSNTGFVIAAEVIEALTHQPAAYYIQKNLFEPLGLRFTFNPSQGNWKKLKQKADFTQLVPQLQYDPTNTQNLYSPRHTEDMSIAIGAASIVTTANDLLQWNLALHKYRSVLPPVLYSLLIKPGKEDYGYGIGIINSSLGPILKHQGTIGTFRSDLVYLPSQDLSIVVLTHVSDDWTRLQEECERLFNMSPSAHYMMCQAHGNVSYSNTRGYDRLTGLLSQLFNNV